MIKQEMEAGFSGFERLTQNRKLESRSYAIARHSGIYLKLRGVFTLKEVAL